VLQIKECISIPSSFVIFTFGFTFEFFKKFEGVLEIIFLAHGVMDALGIVYPQYWLQLDCDGSFAKHFEIFKMIFCYNQTHKVNE